MPSTTLAPLALAAAGADVPHVGTIAEASAAHAELLAALAAAQAAAAGQSAELHELFARSHATGTTEQLASALADAESADASARSAAAEAQAAVEAALAADVADALGAEALAVFARVQANLARPVPDAFKALDRSPEQWRLLERAWLRSSSDRVLSEAESAALAAAQSDPVTVLVSARLQLNLAAVEQAWAATRSPAQPAE